MDHREGTRETDKNAAVNIMQVFVGYVPSVLIVWKFEKQLFDLSVWRVLNVRFLTGIRTKTV